VQDVCECLAYMYVLTRVAQKYHNRHTYEET